ncbi:hypothetical protein IL306_013803 [Fusarium sp. DS 682]|nr:hypothetical protein IL306_013803 [Fusarium sp. DS 682]
MANAIPIIAGRDPAVMYSYNRAQIYQFLDDVAANPVAHQVAGGQAIAQELQQIVGELRSLRYSGSFEEAETQVAAHTDMFNVSMPGQGNAPAEYTGNQGLEPRQHIFRRTNVG